MFGESDWWLSFNGMFSNELLLSRRSIYGYLREKMSVILEEVDD